MVCSWQGPPFAPLSCRAHQEYYYSTSIVILVEILPDMGIFFHHKSPTTKLQLLKLSPFQLRDRSKYRPSPPPPQTRQQLFDAYHPPLRKACGPCWDHLYLLIMGAEVRGRAKRPRYEGREWTHSKSTRTCQNRWPELSIVGQ